MGASSSKGFSVNVQITPEEIEPDLNSVHEDNRSRIHFWNTDPPLIRACRRGNAVEVTELIKKSSTRPFTTRNNDGDTALIMASKKGKYKVAKILLEWIKKTNHGTTAISEENKEGETALYCACQRGDSALIFLLLEHGAFSLENSKDRTLIWASTNNHFEIMRQILHMSAQAEKESVEPTVGVEIQDEYVPEMGGRQCINSDLHTIEELRQGSVSPKKKKSYGKSKLMKIAESEEDPIRITPLLRDHSPLDTKDNDGYTALMWACKNLNTLAIDLLIDHGASTHIEDNNLETALIHICKHTLSDGLASVTRVSKLRPFTYQYFNQQDSHEGKVGEPQIAMDPIEKWLNLQVDIAGKLLSSVEPIDRKNEKGETALMLACKNSCEKAGIVKELLKAGALVDETDNRGRTALMLACRNGHEEKVETLLEFKADVNLRERKDKNSVYRSALWYNINRKPKPKIVKLLLDAGAGNKDLDVFIDILKKRSQNVNTAGRGTSSLGSNTPRSSSNRTTIDETDNNEIDSIVKLLEDGLTVVWSLVKRETKHCATQMLKVEQTKQIKGINYKNKWGESALICACMNGNEKLVELLLEQKEKKINVNITDNNRDTPLIVASRQGHTKVVRHLIDVCECELEFVHQNKEGNTALHYASIEGHLEIVNLLLTCRVNTSLKNRNDETPLTAMCAVEILKPLHIEIANSLLKSSSFAKASVQTQKEAIEKKQGGDKVDVKGMLNADADADADVAPQPLQVTTPLQQQTSPAMSLKDNTSTNTIANTTTNTTILQNYHEHPIEHKEEENGNQQSDSNLDVDVDAIVVNGLEGKIVPLWMLRNKKKDKKESFSKLVTNQILHSQQDYHEEVNNALIKACRGGHKDLVELLLEKNAVQNVKDFEKKTFLRAALMNKHSDVCKLLLRKLELKYAVRLMLASTSVKDN
eukprot:gene7182-14635_t